MLSGLQQSLGDKIGNKVVLGNDLTEDTWRAMDKKVCLAEQELPVHHQEGKYQTHGVPSSTDMQVNKYPGARTFTAIGTGGEDFKRR
jgi:hypothetical protein